MIINKLFDFNNFFDIKKLVDFNKLFDIKKLFDFNNFFDIKKLFDFNKLFDFLWMLLTPSAASIRINKLEPCSTRFMTQ